MHLPDGFLSLPVAAGVGAAAAGAVALALRKCRTELDDRAEPLLGVTAAVIFAAQMVNFPILGGTSGHLMGGVLAAVVLGPWPGVLAMTCVLIVQCFLFADGGLLALGANVFNMAVVSCLAGGAIYSLLRSFFREPIAAGIAAWCATILSAAFCALELAASGAFGLTRTLGLMVGIHAAIGLGEAIITGLVVAALLRRRALLVARPATSPSRSWPAVGGGLALAATVVVLLAPIASSYPDGLERVLAMVGGGVETPAPFPDYAVRNWSDNLGTIATGLIGVAVVALLGWMAAKLRFPGPKPDPSPT
jgi:cobalt/nickel transport system permease protein